MTRERQARWAEASRALPILPAPVPREAVRAFRALPLRTRIAVVEELVATRCHELCRAYRDVVSVAEGFRHRGSPRRGRRRVVPEPCVTFVVREKKAPRRVAAQDRIPAHLLAYWTVGRKRILCGVPTDVEDGRERAAIRPHADVRTVKVTTEDDAEVTGVIACVITRTPPSTPQILYAVSAKHVFSLSRDLGEGEVVGARVRVDDAAVALGETVRVAGRLSDRATHSFDSQLAQITSDAQARAALGNAQPTRWAETKDDIRLQSPYAIHTPDGRLDASFKEFANDMVIDYEHPELRAIRHAQLVMSTADTPAAEGDSGSPVLTRDGRVLLGMHIAGNPAGLCAMIPAWQLLNPARYQFARDDESWDLWRGRSSRARRSASRRRPV